MKRRILLGRIGNLWMWTVQTHHVRKGKRPTWTQTSTGSITWTGITKAKVRAYLVNAYSVEPIDIIEVGDGR